MTGNDAAVRDTWTPRDYPVLVAAAEYLDSHPGQSTRSVELASELGIDHADVLAALLTLAPTYLVTREDRRGANMLASITVARLTDEGRREAGLWPKQADHLTSLIAALDAAAQRADSAEERSTLGSIGDGLKAAPGSVLSGVLTAWLASQGGI